ncbi:MAG: type II toxin-antitoxin system VapC family toxin [Gaiellaceae bacterium]
MVPDASVAIRALMDEAPDALGWFERIHTGDVVAQWPELACLEVANSLRTYVRAKRVTRDGAIARLDEMLRWPIATVRLSELATGALTVGLDRGLTPYDACYVVLAELRGATLVTADRKLAAATPNAVLLD